MPVSVEICLHDLTPLEKEKMQQIALVFDQEATTTLSFLYWPYGININIHLLSTRKQMLGKLAVNKSPNFKKTKCNLKFV